MARQLSTDSVSSLSSACSGASHVSGRRGVPGGTSSKKKKGWVSRILIFYVLFTFMTKLKDVSLSCKHFIFSYVARSVKHFRVQRKVDMDLFRYLM
jgi:hypothetical protein